MHLPFASGGGHRLGGGGGAAPPGGGYSVAPHTEYPQYSVVGTAAGVALFLLVSLAGAAATLSIGTVPPLFYGIMTNQYTKVTDTDTLYKAGRYFIGPLNKFVLFPATVQTVEFTNEVRLRPAGIRYESLHTRTKEGLGLHLQVSMQYQLVKDEVGKLYQSFNKNYEQVFTSSVRELLIQAASEYESVELWQDRERIGQVMQQMVDKELRKTHARCWNLQLLVIDLPDTYENSIVRSEVQKQSMFMKEQEQLSAKIRAETTVIAAEYDREVKVILSQGHANYTLRTQRAHAYAQQRKIETESEVYGMLKQSLQLAPDGLVSYFKYGAMDDLGSASVFYGFGGPSQMMMQANGGAPAR